MANHIQNVIVLSLCISAFLFVLIRINTVENNFDLYLAKYNKSYNSSEYKAKFEIYRKSIDIVNKYNTEGNDNLSAVYGITEFTDLIPEIFLPDLLYSTHISPIQQKHIVWTPTLNIPVKVDWRDKGVISQINNQKGCGACYAFTTIQTIESMIAIRTGKLEKLSVQQMIDCSFVNHGCDGGDSCILLEWIRSNNVSIIKEEEYPLQLVTEQCKRTNFSKGIHIETFKCENFVNNEEIILKYLANNGPVIAAINAGPWYYYIDGIVRYHCDGSVKYLNHAVQIVGYDMSGRVPYYIVRNSWGKNFGANGYLKIAVGQNACGIANKIVTITV